MADEIRNATSSLRALTHLRKVVFCAGELVRNEHFSRSDWTPLREYGYVNERNQKAARRLLSIPQLTTARVNRQEWRRIQPGIQEHIVLDDPEEWKERVWWD